MPIQYVLGAVLIVTPLGTARYRFLSETITFYRRPVQLLIAAARISSVSFLLRNVATLNWFFGIALPESNTFPAP